MTALRFESVEGITSLALDVALALAAIRVPCLDWQRRASRWAHRDTVGLYAAAATSRRLFLIALATAVVGPVVIGWWIYELAVAVSGSL